MTVSESESPLRVFLLSGPSGVGKTTIVERLLDTQPVPLIRAVSATTRPARVGEIDGESYYFLTRDEFERRRDNNEFLEWAEVHQSGFFYGTLRSELKRAYDAGAWAFLEIDVQGALAVMKDYPQTVSVFLTVPSVEDYERRLRARGTESEDILKRRLRTAEEELKHANQYGHQVVNDDLDRAVTEIATILQSQGEDPSHA